ncbi:hypothetical protein [Acetobacterium wieringae]|uniref:hypothetical protein n=1 Tax=Acetobacterium wieringae TaxID=52694 RepID=UPI002034637D|nr:hypothetical protein [Acetobacterium wieringae]URN83961.1 hypothetical protein CHL1_003125 [Acetobacterium wieringae]
METLTPNYGLRKQDEDEFYSETINSDNMDIIDSELKENADNIATIDTRLDNKEILNAVTLTAAGWSASAPYTQTVAVTGITAGRLPDKIIPQYSATTATAISQREAYCMISHYDTGSGTITFTCLEDKLTVDIPLQIVGV